MIDQFYVFGKNEGITIMGPAMISVEISSFNKLENSKSTCTDIFPK